MSVLKTYPLNGPAFIRAVITDMDFMRDGVVQGRDGSISYAAMDPARHPMMTWVKQGKPDDYEESATALKTVVFTNGPMMDNPYISTNVAVGTGAATFGIGAVAFGIAKLAGLSFLAASGVGIVVIVLVGAAAVAYINHKADQFAPFSHVKGDFGTDLGREYADWAWFARSSVATFASHQMGQSSLPPDLKYVCGGMSPLVFDFAALSHVPGDPRYSKYYKGAYGGGSMAAWALIPLPVPGQDPLPDGKGLKAADLDELYCIRPNGTIVDGILLAAGGESASTTLAGILAGIGAREAVATDGSGSVMFGWANQRVIPASPNLSWKAREELQTYGIHCP